MSDASSRWQSLATKSADFLVRFVFPATCAGCGAAVGWLCELCARELVDISGRSVASAPVGVSVDASQHGGSSPVEMRARFAYSGPARKAVHLLKYSGERARAEWFAEMMAPLVPAHNRDRMLIVPVPLTARRERRRGYNQSAEIADRLSQIVGLPVDRGTTRIRETRPQVELDGIERLHNVRGAFSGSRSLRGKHVILVDDVVTTGATMRECGRACYLAGAVSVVGIAGTAGLARGESRTGQNRR